MPHPRFDRSRVAFRPLADRVNRADIARDAVDPADAGSVEPAVAERVLPMAERVREARAEGRPVILAFGAHTIKNGLSLVLQELVRRGVVTHLATNGAGIIHDWEFSWLGQSSEHVAENVREGTFGNWQETGWYLNLALNVGAYRGLGYGESVGAMILNEYLDIPDEASLVEEVRTLAVLDAYQAAAAAELLSVVRTFKLDPGKRAIPHKCKAYSIQGFCYRKGVPFTGHPMFGHDIIYNHPMNSGVLLGRAAQRDFEMFAHAVSRLEGGVYLSLGSAVMSPMIFEKSLSMAQNVAIQEGLRIENHFIGVVDLAPGEWDWSKGEPPESHPAYYLRYNKSFSRMGGSMQYLSMDNRDFLLALLHHC